MAILIDLPAAQQSDRTMTSTPESFEESLSSSIVSMNLDESPGMDKSFEILDRGISSRNTEVDMRNDSQGCRELCSKGKGGSRRRKRFENAHFLNVPNSQPPLPSDWEVHPTYTIHHNLPYYLAPLWDTKYQRLVEERKNHKSSHHQTKVPQDLKITLKKAKGARSLLQHLECNIRTFIQRSQDRCVSANNETCREIDSEDEEIVFIGRKNDGCEISMSDEVETAAKQDLKLEKLTFENSPQHGGGFMRWLVHELADYYGLESRSEAKERRNSSGNVIWGREITVSFPASGGNSRHDAIWSGDSVINMPRPLYDDHDLIRAHMILTPFTFFHQACAQKLTF